MEKMIVKDKTELKIKEGAALNAVTALADDWSGVGKIAETLRKKGNLDEVQFASDDVITGVYHDMKLEMPLFYAVDVTEDGKIKATFAIREKTEMERRLDALEAGQNVQDGAIMELAGMMGGEA